MEHFYGDTPRYVFLTINSWERVSALAVPEFADRVRDQLLASAAQFNVEIIAYTLMPDHVRVLTRASRGEDIWECMRRWKQRTGYWWKQGGKGHALWQRGYHDRVLRRDQDPLAFVEYIMMNPVRRKLVAKPQDYKWSATPGLTAWKPEPDGELDRVRGLNLLEA